ncbi:MULTISPECIES: pyruvate:ferredoxin (flavodoxin) oxidoreductase [Acetobacter]|uniref:Pyruvate-flavodoxin oxidoreductase n=3 Tax=Acetobacter TaxID=434 RepID=A0AAN1PHF1_9PROT|nr:pyruvate:ferredoxin (flavodoxin) oxidoreductase [Acetobacter oryzifermentans]AXN00230.1 pyruvate:ferredoxin (flavodoxin) oxidoreductase [Acetobacter pomorum]KAA8393483.1 pyruvate:ferredoxin (flavodoxin) oxidoreductase [Acetobacter sp. DmW_125128]KAA8393627.1 pyruvate:ferredoxin (flavodoxin) oxidoreductase [Acetobacter sp. DmW_125124]KAA8393920.1 pyruvate:ferredoxin (flavodoxin) oxidoreductase [Acetobacter sp. DmW_125127]KAA8401412.1 pyruvate:ferredoxin (flavodoxin) oxidoreductase [Acetobact
MENVMAQQLQTMDGNTSVAHIAYRVNEVCAIYPITPSSPMAELADTWSDQGVQNIWGEVPVVQEMQAEGGAAGCVHGALQTGALTTTFTASQGLMLMLPNMFKIAGELTSTVFYVAARALAAGASSIFGDHQDIMAARTTGFAMLGAGSVQESHDLALVAQVATLAARIPFIHFADGFRTSHEYNSLSMVSDNVIRQMIDDRLVYAHRQRALNPEHPFIRGTWQNPDTYFQTREAVNPFYERVPAIVQEAMDKFASLTGRQYDLFHYTGAPDAERVVISMGSGSEVVRETAKWLNAHGEKVGALHVRLFRPFSAEHFLKALPASVKSIAVLDRTKEPGAPMEPLHADIVGVLAEGVGNGQFSHMPRVIGGRYGLSSRDFSPAMARAVFDELKKPTSKNHFTVGIIDDVSHTHLEYDETFDIEPESTVRCLFYGLGADGTVGANKNSVKILSEKPGWYAQAYFDYDSHKSGAETASHLRFGKSPIQAPYLIRHADFVACHKFDFLFRRDILGAANNGATFLLNSPYAADKVWEQLPRKVQDQIVNKKLRFFVIDASDVALKLGLGPRINTILQTCFFHLSNVLPSDEAITEIKKSIQKTYGAKGDSIVQLNFRAVDAAVAALHEVAVPAKADGTLPMPPVVPPSAPLFVQQVTAEIMAGRGESIPVSHIPADGTFPGGTTQYEKRNIAVEVPIWNPDTCIQCGQCSIVCPHSVIRAKTYEDKDLTGAPASFKSAPVNARGYPDARFTLQFYVEDCTGCGVCVENCPEISPDGKTRAINMGEKLPILEQERGNIAFFEHLPEVNRAAINEANVRGVQFLEPLFEFSGACAGCGETPYLKLISQLFGDRLQIANATGCSAIYAGNTPAHAWKSNAQGRGVAWSNSLFEDNAEFGLGFRLAADKQESLARQLLQKQAQVVGQDLATAILNASQITESEFALQRERVGALRSKLEGVNTPDAAMLLSVADFLIRRSIWIVGGDGWAYDIDYGGLDHVLAQGRNVNVIVLDTEVYSNTGGQSSKATPLGASAKFAAGGKRVPRKDLALQTIAYGNVYVAQIALGANPEQAIIAMREAEAYEGPSLILAYSQCIAHGIDMRTGMKQQARAVASGYWPLFRFDPTMRKSGLNPFRLDSTRPRIPLEDYAYRELRYKTLTRTHPQSAAHLLHQAQAAANERYRIYEDMAARDGSRFLPHWEDVN